MDKHVDLTEDNAFSKRRIHKVLIEGRTPWDTWQPSVWIAEALKNVFKETVACERCGSSIAELPWLHHYGLCERCERDIEKVTMPWRDPDIKDGYRDVFLTEFMDVRRNHQ